MMRRASFPVVWVAMVSVVLTHLRPAEGGTPPMARAALDAFADEWFAWRSVVAPITSDDLPRTGLRRPPGWAPNVSAAALLDNKVEYERFARQLLAIRTNTTGAQRDAPPPAADIAFDGWHRDDQADWWALSSGLARHFYELHILRPHTRDAGFYVQQGPGAVWDSLVRQNADLDDGASGSSWAGWWTKKRLQAELLPRVAAIPAILSNGTTNLRDGAEAVAAFADAAIAELADFSQALPTAVAACVNATGDLPLDDPLRDALAAAAGEAARSAAGFRGWLLDHRNDSSVFLQEYSGIGKEAYAWFLRHVSLVSNTSAADIASIGNRLASRNTARLNIIQRRHNASGVPPMPLFPTVEAQSAATSKAYGEVVAFLRASQLVTMPSWLPTAAAGYNVLPIPPWLKPFSYSALGEEDDFSSGSAGGSTASRQRSMARYVPDPRPGLPFFLATMAQDPRPVIVHEGLPGHWFQFASSWRNVRHCRRHWLDSVANEGLAFYMEGMVLEAGLFDDQPRLRETMHSMARLRGLRAEIDVSLNLGLLTVEAAVEKLVREVPMSPTEARGEVTMRLQTPGQGYSYALGHAQVTAFLARAQEAKGALFDIREFHDLLVQNGNLPVELQEHVAGTALLHTDFINVHSVFASTPRSPADLPDGQTARVLLSDPTLIQGLPGADVGMHTMQYSGYLPVAGLARVQTADGTARSLFYWLVRGDTTGATANATATPPMGDSTDNADVPLVVWLQGGNGCSSLIGCLSENGPQGATSGTTLARNPFSWHLLPANVVYVDRPAGAGFSWSEAPPHRGQSGNYANDATTARDTVVFLRGLLAKYPWLCGSGRKIWVAGESYAGHFTVQLATLLAQAEAAGDGLCLHLGGVLAGNAVVDLNQTNYAWFEAGYTHSLVSEDTWRGLQGTCEFSMDMGVDGNGCPCHQTPACKSFICRWMNESGSGGGLISLYNYYTSTCPAQRAARRSAATPGPPDACPSDAADPCVDDFVAAYLNQPRVRRQLHVDPNRSAAVWSGCSEVLNDNYNCTDSLVSVAPLYHDLVRRYNKTLLVYSGDVDGVVPTLATRRWLHATFGDAQTAWRPWLGGDGQLAGYTQGFGDAAHPETGTGVGSAPVVFATVRDAGHMVPMYQPARAFEMARRFMRNQDL